MTSGGGGGIESDDARLPGEVDSETSPLLEDAQHWLSVYQELLTFKRSLVQSSELERMENRHRFWQERVRQLQELTPGSARPGP